MDTPQQSPRQRNEHRLSRIKTGVLIAAAAAFAAIGGAVATNGTGGGDGTTATPVSQDAVQQTQDSGQFSDQGTQDAGTDQGGFFSQDQGAAPVMGSGGS